MNGRLAGVSAVVTGGGSGIGRAVVEAYLAEGAAVTVLERSRAMADELAAAHGAGLQPVVGDGTDPVAIGEAVRRAARVGRPYGQLTCCVGIHDGFASLRTLDTAALAQGAREVWTVNVLSTLLAVREAYPWLRDTSGSVTLTVSESAFHPTGGGVLYGSSKWALRGAIDHLSADLAPYVRVNGVSPGGTTGTRFAGPPSLGEPRPADTRPGRDQAIAAGNALGVVPAPADHAGAYLYLADPVAARVVTGVVLPTDGGRR